MKVPQVPEGDLWPGDVLEDLEEGGLLFFSVVDIAATQVVKLGADFQAPIWEVICPRQHRRRIGLHRPAGSLSAHS